MEAFEVPKIKKTTSTLINDFYDSQTTSLLTFHFESQCFPSIQNRLQKSHIIHESIDDKDLYVIDGFFDKEEGDALRGFFQNATYSTISYGNYESVEKQEIPAYSTNNKERWNLFWNPVQPVYELYKFLSTLGNMLDAEVITLPWELRKGSNGSPAVITNYLEKVSSHSMLSGKHKDYAPEKGLAFSIPNLYSKDQKFHTSTFKNGTLGKPWLVTLMLYATSKSFLPEYRMGTVFFKENEEPALNVSCIHTRLVLFAGDITHSTDESNIPESVEKPWRISHVFKLIINPRSENQCLKEQFQTLIKIH